MATYHWPILGIASTPDTSGNVWVEPAALDLQVNARYPQLVIVYADTSTRDTFGGRFEVPQNYVGTAKLGLHWATTATTGNARWEFDYTTVANGGSVDPAADQESVGTTVAAPGTARLLTITEITLTAANFAAGSQVQFRIARNGAGADTIAAACFILHAYFSYTDV